MYRQHAIKHQPSTRADAGPLAAPVLAHNPSMELQRGIGNQAIGRLLHQHPPAGWSGAETSARTPTGVNLFLQRKCACGGEASAPAGECEECSRKKMADLQTKLEINEPGDAHEQEADRIAEQVMSQPAQVDVGNAPPSIQRFAGPSGGQTDAAPSSVDRVLASPGTPLEPALRHDMEHRFGHDFARVRLHTDAAADQSARQVNANAYTVGHDIVFRAGRFAPATHGGRRLLAHELTHVVQQSGTDNAMCIDAGEKALFRQPAEAHYPTEEEQRNIEELLRRNRKTTTVVTSTTGEQ